MLPEIHPLLDSIHLYNNYATMAGRKGYLNVDLDIYPSPRIRYYFEVIGEEVLRDGRLSGAQSLEPIEGYRIRIDRPAPTRDRHDSSIPLTSISGLAANVVIGDLDARVHGVNFYLPNTRFQSNSINQKSIKKIVKADGAVAADDEYPESLEGRFVEAQLIDGWNIRLEIGREALKWIDELAFNVGTRITTLGELYANKPGDDGLYSMISLSKAQEYIEWLSILLSFANGGYLGPVLISGYSPINGVDGIAVQNAIAMAYKTTPAELLGHAWIAYDSSLEDLLACFPAFYEMVQTPPWNEALGVILSWYFQAIQPESGQSGYKSWPIIANAVGTALERLAYTILVLEESDLVKRQKFDSLFQGGDSYKAHWSKLPKGESRTGKRLQLLLERIGLGLTRGHWDTREVYRFLALRNNATHPQQTAAIDSHTLAFQLNQAMQWIEETLLWRFGYKGKYVIRSAGVAASINPRYDLSTRDPNWQHS